MSRLSPESQVVPVGNKTEVDEQRAFPKDIGKKGNLSPVEKRTDNAGST